MSPMLVLITGLFSEFPNVTTTIRVSVAIYPLLYCDICASDETN